MALHKKCFIHHLEYRNVNLNDITFDTPRAVQSAICVQKAIVHSAVSEWVVTKGRRKLQKFGWDKQFIREFFSGLAISLKEYSKNKAITSQELQKYGWDINISSVVEF